MAISLNNLTRILGHKSRGKRVGRGHGSGKGGHTTGLGTKGQKARQGTKPHAWFEGGQTPLVRKTPYHKGFKAHGQFKVVAINLADLVRMAGKSTDITVDEVRTKLKSKDSVDFIKILGRGDIKTSLNVKGFWYSTAAKEKIEKSGGKVE